MMTKYPLDPAALRRLEDNTTSHKPDEDQVARMAHVRMAVFVLGHKLLELVPPGREQSLALTNLEQVMFWANAGIARGLKE